VVIVPLRSFGTAVIARHARQASGRFENQLCGESHKKTRQARLG
jgi:hypothetical protein